MKITSWHGKHNEGIGSVPASRLLKAPGGTLLLVTAGCGSPTATHAGLAVSTSRAAHPSLTPRSPAPLTPSPIPSASSTAGPQIRRQGELVLEVTGRPTIWTPSWRTAIRCAVPHGSSRTSRTCLAAITASPAPARGLVGHRPCHGAERAPGPTRIAPMRPISLPTNVKHTIEERAHCPKVSGVMTAGVRFPSPGNELAAG